MERSVAFKVTYQGGNRRFVMNTISWNALVERIVQSFQLPSQPDNTFGPGLQLTYVDEDKDQIVLDGNEELQAAVYQLQSDPSSPAVLRLWLLSDEELSVASERNNRSINVPINPPPMSNSTEAWILAEATAEGETTTTRQPSTTRGGAIIQDEDVTSGTGEDFTPPPPFSLSSTVENRTRLNEVDSSNQLNETVVSIGANGDDDATATATAAAADDDTTADDVSDETQQNTQEERQEERQEEKREEKREERQEEKREEKREERAAPEDGTNMPRDEPQPDMPPLGAQFINLIQQFSDTIRNNPELVENARSVTHQTVDVIESNMLNLFTAIREQLKDISPKKPEQTSERSAPEGSAPEGSENQNWLDALCQNLWSYPWNFGNTASSQGSSSRGPKCMFRGSPGRGPNCMFPEAHGHKDWSNFRHSPRRHCHHHSRRRQPSPAPPPPPPPPPTYPFPLNMPPTYPSPFSVPPTYPLPFNTSLSSPTFSMPPPPPPPPPPFNMPMNYDNILGDTSGCLLRNGHLAGIPSPTCSVQANVPNVPPTSPPQPYETSLASNDTTEDTTENTTENTTKNTTENTREHVTPMADVQTTASQPSPDDTESGHVYESLNAQLYAMGFEDRDLNLRLLERFEGDVAQVANHIVDTASALEYQVFNSDDSDDDDIYF